MHENNRLLIIWFHSTVSMKELPDRSSLINVNCHLGVSINHRWTLINLQCSVYTIWKPPYCKTEQFRVHSLKRNSQEDCQWASCWSALPDRLPIVVEDLPFVVMNWLTLIYQQISNSTRGQICTWWGCTCLFMRSSIMYSSDAWLTSLIPFRLALCNADHMSTLFSLENTKLLWYYQSLLMN